MTTRNSAVEVSSSDFKDAHGLNIVQDDGDGNADWSKDEEKKLVQKVDLFLLPTIWLMYLLSYMDRTK